MYDKPHLSYREQLDKLLGRGLSCSDESAALDVLRAVGYYRLSAYVYPFRTMLAADAPRTSSVHHRAERMRDGASFEQVVALWRFDRKLRLTCLDAIETVEIGMRTKIAHVLGHRDPFGHVTRDALDPAECDKPVPRSVALEQPSGPADAFEQWIVKYESLARPARNEDYVKHNLEKYGDPLPVWVGVEFLDLGALVRLYKLLHRDDQNTIAREVSVTEGRLLADWLRDINYLRNVCAHHSRLWNRTLTMKPRKFSPQQVHSSLKHAAQTDRRDKVYVLLAELAYLVRHIDPGSTWAESGLRTIVRKFPSDGHLSPEADMGFPPGWSELDLWRRVACC